MLIELLNNTLNGKVLSTKQSSFLLNEILKGEVPELQVASFISAIRTRGETSEELVGFVKTLREHSISVDGGSNIIDTCGTGGDGSGTFNISTASALVVASAGVKVAKHGNRSVSSKCGSADVLEELGLSLQSDPVKAKNELENIGFSFLFAPNFHPAFKELSEFRKKLGVPTIFNLLGPLLNPAQTKRQVTGVANQKYLLVMANAMKLLEYEEAFIVCSDDGLDEFSLSDSTSYYHLKDGELELKTMTPEELGLERCQLKDLKGGDSKVNASIIENIFAGQKGPCRDVVLLNSAASFVISGTTSTFKEGIELAREVIDSKATYNYLNKLRGPKC